MWTLVHLAGYLALARWLFDGDNTRDVAWIVGASWYARVFPSRMTRAADVVPELVPGAAR